MAMCVMAVAGAAPCQCFSLGANEITSPGRISSTGPPSRCARPQPAVTIRVCPSGCVCHAVRAPGSNVTLAPDARAGACAWNNGSMRTVPVNQSAGPLLDGCEPFCLISILSSFLSVAVSINGTPACGRRIAGIASAEAVPAVFRKMRREKRMSLTVPMTCRPEQDFMCVHVVRLAHGEGAGVHEGIGKNRERFIELMHVPRGFRFGDAVLHTVCSVLKL